MHGLQSSVFFVDLSFSYIFIINYKYIFIYYY